MTLQSWWTFPRGRSSPRMMRRRTAISGCSWTWTKKPRKPLDFFWKYWNTLNQLKYSKHLYHLYHLYLPGEPNWLVWPCWSSWWQFVSSDSECTNCSQKRTLLCSWNLFLCMCMLRSVRTSSNQRLWSPWLLYFANLHYIWQYFTVQRFPSIASHLFCEERLKRSTARPSWQRPQQDMAKRQNSRGNWKGVMESCKRFCKRIVKR